MMSPTRFDADSKLTLRGLCESEDGTKQDEVASDQDDPEGDPESPLGIESHVRHVPRPPGAVERNGKNRKESEEREGLHDQRCLWPLGGGHLEREELVVDRVEWSGM
jgi:hypothetical protein